jgi:hypothetical protein
MHVSAKFVVLYKCQESQLVVTHSRLIVKTLFDFINQKLRRCLQKKKQQKQTADFLDI